MILFKTLDQHNSSVVFFIKYGMTGVIWEKLYYEEIERKFMPTFNSGIDWMNAFEIIEYIF